MLGKILMTLGTLAYGFMPLVMDLNHSHVFHHDWPGHARVHVVWLLITSTLLGCWSLWLIWGRHKHYQIAVNQACGIGVALFVAFFAAVITAPLYGGSIVEPNAPKILPGGPYASSIATMISLILLLAGWRLTSKRIST